MANESTEAPTSHRGPGFHLAVWIALSVLFLYPLSVCPAAKVFGNSPPPAVKILYAPLGYLYQKVPVVHAFYQWYAKVWGVRL